MNKGLNKEQRRAVDIKSGPALVVAGAGTGKTRVIVERIVRLIGGGTDPKSIVALTFTEKAAAEMQDRVNELRGGYNFDLKIMTYNAYGEQILRRFAADIGLNGQLKLMADAAQLVFLREHLDELGLDYYAPITNPEGHLKDLAEYFSRLKQNVVRPEAYAKFADGLPDKSPADKLEKQRHRELAKVFKTYIDLCKRANVIDYDDQLYLVLELFAKRPNVRTKVQAEIEHLLVDEFQDTNAMQSDFLDALVQRHGNIMVVGDDDQSIYGWRGATLDNILSFKQRYPAAQEVVLTRNYRSGQALLDASYKLIKHNDPYRLEAQHGFDKRLKAGRAGKSPQFKSFASHNEELTFVAKDIRRRLKQGQEPGSIAVLARSHGTIARIHDLFDAYDINHSIAGLGHELYAQPLITDIIDVLRAVADPADNACVYQALVSLAFPDVSPGQLSTLSSQARRRHQNLLDLAMASQHETVREAAQTLKDWHEQSASRPVSQTLYAIFEQKLKPWLFDLLETEGGEAAAEQAGRDLSELFNILREFERVAVRTTVRGFVDNVETLKAAGQNVVDDSYLLDNEAVNVITVHKAKGLEWDTVYIVNLVKNGFPKTGGPTGLELPAELSRAASADDALLEERRLMYVAMTRAAQELILTCSERLRQGGQRQRPSIFIAEALGEIEPAITSVSGADRFDFIQPRSPSLPAGRLPGSMVDGDQLVLSASQIETFIFCPLNFYYKYVLNWPEEPSASAGIGQAVHDAIADINRAILAGQTLTPAQAKELLERNWPQEGFATLKRRQIALKQSAQVITDYLAREKSAKRHPDLIEEEFSFLLAEGNVRVHGRFDAVYSHGSVEIRDYKTGDVNDQESADHKAEKSDQLSIYALAWEEAFGQIPSALTLDFVTGGFVGHSARSQTRINNMRRKIGQIADAIRRHDFPPKGRHDICLHPPLNE